MPIAYLGLGSNLGDRCSHLRAAVAGLQERDDVHVQKGSPVYETEAHTPDPTEEQPPYLNAVVEAKVTCMPEHLLQVAQALERAAGRAADRERWAPRPLDVDLLAVGAVTCETDVLTLPHPRLAERRFVLRPWADLSPNFAVPPPFDATVRGLLDACADPATIQQTSHTLGDAGSTPTRSGNRP